MQVKRARLPLTALRSFEAAGRHLSFSRAAEELFVSQAAISRQVRELEQFVGQQLFTRLHRRVELTPVGVRLLAQLTASFDQIEGQLAGIRSAGEPRQVRVSAEPYLAGSWLLPRLSRFLAARPDVDVSVEGSAALAAFRGSEKPDIAIRHSLTASSWPGTEALRLLESRVTPVVAPAFAASGPGLHRPTDLLNYTLLHEDNRNTWSHWLEAAGVYDGTAHRGSLFSDGAMAVKAALLGQGIALGDPILDAMELESGRLIRPFELSVPYGTYWLVASDFGRLEEPARAFVEWLLSEAKESEVSVAPPAPRARAHGTG